MAIVPVRSAGVKRRQLIGKLSWLTTKYETEEEEHTMKFARKRHHEEQLQTHAFRLSSG